MTKSSRFCSEKKFGVGFSVLLESVCIGNIVNSFQVSHYAFNAILFQIAFKV